MTRVLLCAGASVAVYKACDLASKLTQAGDSVRAVLTPNAAKLVSPQLFEAVTGERAHVDELSDQREGAMDHITLTDWGELLLVAPASADLIARLALGLGGDLVGTVSLAWQAGKPRLLCPAMNPNMLSSGPLQRHLETLRGDGWQIMEPGEGHMACGVAGKGRLPEPLEIQRRIRELTAGGGRMKVVVTAGPTREYVDPVRYLSNESSGRMGFEIARAAAAAGFQVTLIAGPVNLETPEGVRRVDVVTAREMLAEVRKAFRQADALYMAAAVADWRPARRLSGKWRAKDGGAERTSLDLIRNPDVLATVARGKGERLVVGFALETADGERRALRKLAKKGLDYIVLNDDSALNASRTTVSILGKDGSVRRLENRPKPAVARVLVRLASAWPTKSA